MLPHHLYPIPQREPLIPHPSTLCMCNSTFAEAAITHRIC
jgi:hypothetical protein